MLIEGSEDAEELVTTNQTFLNSPDLDFNSRLRVGLRYDICLAPDQTIRSASILFTAEEDDDNDTVSTVRAELTADANSFALQSMAARRLTTASAEWTIDPWTQDEQYVSPDLTAMISEIVELPQWSGCGHIVFVFETVGGDRDAYSVETDPDLASILRIVTD